MTSRLALVTFLLALSFIMTIPLRADLPPHPRLLLNAKGVEELKTRIANAPFAKTYWAKLKRDVDAAVDQKIDLPPRGGNWMHWYICPKHAVGLRKGEQIGPWQWTHICPVDHEQFTSDPKDSSKDYDGCVINDIHDHYADLIRDCGLLYQVTGEKKYADKARAILLAYVEKYPTYPLHNIHGEAKVGGGKVGPQTLDESVWIIPICQGADLIWDTLSDADRKSIADEFLLVSARDVILPHKMPVHNIQCWKNSAVGLIGLLLDDKELIDTAINDPDRGYRTQLAKGVQPDGPWWEGAWGYHFYTLSALIPLAEASHNCGIDLLDPALKKMFDAPLVFAMPNLVMPNFNDSGRESLLGQASLYEWANARFDNPDYARILSKSDRQNTRALVFGKATIPEAPKTTVGSSNHEDSGYAILETPDAKSWLCLKYGPDGGWHGHFDKLHFILYRNGEIVMPDPGTTRYGTPLHNSWYRTTLAHNTLVVDEASQKPAHGKSLAFSAGPTPFIMASAGDIAPGVKFVRTAVMLRDDLFVFIDDVECEKQRQLDLAIHIEGEWSDLLEGKPWKAPDKEGYKHLTDATTRSIEDATRLTVKSEKTSTRLFLAGGEKTELITAKGLGFNPTHLVPVALLRRHAKTTRYIWAISLGGADVELKSDGLSVKVAAGTNTWQIISDASAGRCEV
ncbi:MAG TPA: alginate lyase family protein, partial [Tepidisphaeraceae bacterium]|nr:alginate lyase family protein [Tepidisphaeraceae bacterium]